jgi:hypothetical protein
MPENEWQLRALELAVENVEVGAADTAGTHLEPHLTRLEPRTHDIALDERLPDAGEHDRSHALRLPPDRRSYVRPRPQSSS